MKREEFETRLNNARILHRLIKAKEAEIAELKDSLIYSQDKNRKRLFHLLDQHSKQLEEYLKEYHDLTDLIHNAVGDTVYESVLKLRYIHAKEWSYISDVLSYERRQLNNIKNEAINKVLEYYS